MSHKLVQKTNQEIQNLIIYGHSRQQINFLPAKVSQKLITSDIIYWDYDKPSVRIFVPLRKIVVPSSEKLKKKLFKVFPLLLPCKEQAKEIIS